MDLDDFSEEQQSQIEFFRKQSALITPPDDLYPTSAANDWWWGEILVGFTGGPQGSHWNAMARDLGGTKTQVRARSTSGSAFPSPVAVLGYYYGYLRNLYHLENQKGSWNFNGIHGTGIGSMFLDNGNRVHIQWISFLGVNVVADFQGKLAFENVHRQP